MNSNTTFPAPLSALAFLAMSALLMLCLALAIGFAFGHNTKAVKATLSFALSALAAYVLILLLVSFASQTVLLASGQEKYFCEIDCHIAYSVVTAGYEADTRIAGDTRYLVELETRFDPASISPHRGDGPLTPGPHEVALIDQAGHEYQTAEIQGQSLLTPLRPGESYRTKFIFKIKTAQVEGRAARLFLWVHTRAEVPYWMMIGNEISPLHRKVVFQL